MEIHGREVTFKRTVGANCAIEKYFEPSGGFDLKRISEGSYSEQQTNAAFIMEELSKGAEEAAFWDAYNRGETYMVHPLTRDEAMTLSNEEFNALFVEALKVWASASPTVKAKPAEKKTDDPSD